MKYKIIKNERFRVHFEIRQFRSTLDSIISDQIKNGMNCFWNNLTDAGRGSGSNQGVWVFYSEMIRFLTILC